jgi:hypothetical protein
MFDDAVFQPRLARCEAEEHVVVHTEFGTEPAASGVG